MPAACDSRSMKWAPRLTELSVYKRADAHLTRRTTHGAIGKRAFLSHRAVDGAQPCCGRRCGQIHLVRQFIQACLWPPVAAVTVLGLLLGITLAVHETSWYLSGRATTQVGVCNCALSMLRAEHAAQLSTSILSAHVPGMTAHKCIVRF